MRATQKAGDQNDEAKQRTGSAEAGAVCRRVSMDNAAPHTPTSPKDA